MLFIPIGFWCNSFGQFRKPIPDFVIIWNFLIDHDEISCGESLFGYLGHLFIVADNSFRQLVFFPVFELFQIFAD